MRKDLLKPGKADLWDSGKVGSRESTQIEYAGRPLASETQCYWTVRAWDGVGQASPWSKTSLWTMGMLQPSDWSGKLIGYDWPAGSEKPQIPPAPYFRKEFSTDKPIRRATLYASALGLYEMHLNGKRVGNDYFVPGDCDFRKRTYYVTYDVTKMLRDGKNAIGGILGDGWYAGYLSFSGRREWYGGKPRLLAQLNIEYSDGTRQTVGTGPDWKASYGPIVEADQLMGCVYDFRKELRGWDRAGYRDTEWKPVVVDEGVKQSLSAKPDEPVRKFEEIRAVSMTQPSPGVYVYDLGQNMVGWVRLRVTGKRGQKVIVRHAEMLNPDGTIYTKNLRAARCVDSYFLKGTSEHTLEPYFTFHGFRYVEVTGVDAPPDPEQVEGVVVHSDMTRTGSFECSDKTVNQLVHNIVWGQKGNYLEIPTDCPQRDERAGWTGDAQVFMPTGAYNFDVSAFFTKWLVDLVTDGQRPDGTFPDVAPDLALGAGNTAWGDAAVVCVHHMYGIYGDTRVVKQHYPQLVKYMDWQLANSKDYIRGQGSYGDWLHLGGAPKPEVLGTAYFAYTAGLMSELAEAIGKTDDAKKYGDLRESIKKSFITNFVKDDGSILESGQTGYALALSLDLLPQAVRPRSMEKLVSDLMSRNWHLSTGFVGTPRILLALHSGGRDDVAGKLLLQKTYPSWLYPVTLGATTIWERWDGWSPKKGFQDPGMNSFNHYAFGAVGEHLYSRVAGIEAAAPGYAKVRIQPDMADKLSWATGSYDSIRGRIESSWKKSGRGLTMKVTIPGNTDALVYVPAEQLSSVTESGVPAVESPDLRFVGVDGGYQVFEVGSGRYTFSVE